MFVNRYRINLNTQNRIVKESGPRPVTIKPSGATINIPIDLNYQLVDQSDIIEREFVEKEVENSINPTFDYEKARFIPIIGSNEVDEIKYSVHFLSNNLYPPQSYYGDIGFVYNDVKFRKNRFTNSFLRLSFYDSDKTTDQRLLSFITLFSRITPDDIGSNNLPLPINNIPIRFKLTNPIVNPEGISEGYYIYHFKDEVTTTLPKELYMRASFNNAKDGKTTNLMTENTALPIDELVNKLHTKYVLTRDSDGYYYEIDSSYSNNVEISGNNIVVNLYQVQAL